MPTVKKIGPYRLFFYSNENDEPPHVHVERDRGSSTAKFWIRPVEFAKSHGFSMVQLRAIRQIVEGMEAQIEKAWRDHFGR